MTKTQSNAGVAEPFDSAEEVFLDLEGIITEGEDHDDASTWKDLLAWALRDIARRGAVLKAAIEAGNPLAVLQEELGALARVEDYVRAVAAMRHIAV